jgi:hypothetical protein
LTNCVRCVKLLNDLHRELQAGNYLEHPRGPQRGAALPVKLYRTPLPADFAAAAAAKHQERIEQAVSDAETARAMPLDQLRKVVHSQRKSFIRDGRVVKLEGR